MYDIIFNNKHSFKDFGMKRTNSKEHKAPTKNKIYETVPFMNGSYDFSDIYNGPTYSNRELEYSFLVEVENEQLMNYRKIAIENWLMGTNEKTKLIDEDLQGFYYMAECIDIDFENYYEFGIINATFEAYPFKISNEYEDASIWDTFNFELDMINDTKFNINGEKEVTIYNNSAIEIEPKVRTDVRFEIYQDGEKFIALPGLSGGYMFKLRRGENKLLLKGNGNIEFLFRREVL